MVKTEKDVLFGLFLPLSTGGWIISENTPRIEPSYAMNRNAAILADNMGLDFLLSMMKWRGFGGRTDHWGTSLESIITMTGLAEATSRVKIWCTAHTLLHHPVVMAKMMATLHQVSNGRAGLNIVSGADRSEFEQMGTWRPELDHDQRYDLAREWIEIMMRLWSEKLVNYHGDFFTITDCVCDPKPVTRPDLICAGTSQVGLEFTARYADAAFVAGRTEEELAAVSRRAKDIAAGHGRSIKTFGMYTIVPGATDADAERRIAFYSAGVDVEAVDGMARSYGTKSDGRESSLVARAKRSGFMTSYLAGSAETIRQKIVHTIQTAQLDGMMLIFPDYDQDLRFFGDEILPNLRRSFGATGPAL